MVYNLKHYLKIKGLNTLCDEEKEIFNIPKRKLAKGWLQKYGKNRVDEQTFKSLLSSLQEKDRLNKISVALGDSTSLYIIENGFGHFKIGITKNIVTRMADLSVANSLPLKLIRLYDVKTRPILTERSLHDKFKDIRLCGEWFNETLPINEIDTYLCDLGFSRLYPTGFIE